MSALACGMMATSCGEDEEGTALTGLRVEPSTITKAIDETQQVAVTKVPNDAPEPEYTWTTSDDKVATVSQTGLVTITGIGTATVTVSSGSIKAEVKVNGTVKSLAVKDAAGESVGTYPFDDSSVDTTFTLTATFEPADAGLTPEWSVDVATVTVVPSANGLSAQVTITGPGTAVVTVTVGAATATYTITTTSILETAVGYWTFDDPADLTKAAKGAPLEFSYFTVRSGENVITSVSGPTADNKAAFVPVGAWIKCLHGVLPNGADTAKRVNEFTFMFDVMVPDYSVYHTLIHAGLHDPYNSSLYLKSSGRVGISGPDKNTPNSTVKSNKWYRFVFTAKMGDSETNFYNYYWNGKLLQENPNVPELLTDHSRHSLDPTGVWLFFDSPSAAQGGQGNDSVDDNDINVAAIAVWDHALTAAEVAALGMFAVDSE